MQYMMQREISRNVENIVQVWSIFQWYYNKYLNSYTSLIRMTHVIYHRDESMREKSKDNMINDQIHECNFSGKIIVQIIIIIIILSFPMQPVVNHVEFWLNVYLITPLENISLSIPESFVKVNKLNNSMFAHMIGQFLRLFPI